MQVASSPAGSCPNGHPEQAQAWRLHGAPPTRCPECGETPQFGSFSSIAGFGPDDHCRLPERANITPPRDPYSRCHRHPAGGSLDARLRHPRQPSGADYDGLWLRPCFPRRGRRNRHPADSRPPGPRWSPAAYCPANLAQCRRGPPLAHSLESSPDRCAPMPLILSFNAKAVPRWIRAKLRPGWDVHSRDD